MQSQLPQRKYPRLKSFDYGRGGGYFLTICTHNRKRLLSTISTESKTDGTTLVGWGLAPTESETDGERTMGTEFPNVRLTRFGEIVEKQLLHVQERFKCVTVDRYVIMHSLTRIEPIWFETANSLPYCVEKV